MTLFLGIDGGGTGCRAAIADQAGKILGRAEGGPANIASNPEGARANLLAVTMAALSDAAGPADVTRELPRLRAVLGLAGANVQRSAKLLRDSLPFAHLRLETDALIAVKGALQGTDGIVAALGTGSVFAAQRAGMVRQLGGWGFVLGDEGSGASLGRALLAQALRAVDGFTPITPLLADVLAEFDGPAGIVAFGFAASPADFAALARRVIGSDDPAAQRITSAAIAEVASAITQLQDGAALPVVFLGGLGQYYATQLADRWPMVAPLGTGLDGALWLARQELA